MVFKETAKQIIFQANNDTGSKRNLIKQPILAFSTKPAQMIILDPNVAILTIEFF
jgi:hypothetical protein